MRLGKHNSTGGEAPADGEDPRLRLLVERTPVAMGILSRKGIIEYANPTWARVFGRELAAAGDLIEFVRIGSPSEPEAKRALACWQDEILGERTDEHEPELFQGRVVNTIYRLTRKDGSSFPAEVTISPGEADGKPVALAVVRDVTERAMAEEALRESEESGGVIHQVSQPLNGVVQESIELAGHAARRGGIRFEVSLAPELPQVCADAVQLGQALLNLLQNSIDALAICVPERRRIEVVTGTCDGAEVEVRVRDAGPGISPEVQARLFEPFFTTKPEGTGIGLSLTHTIVAAHGGRVEGCNNEDGIGATFRVAIPIAKRDQ